MCNSLKSGIVLHISFYTFELDFLCFVPNRPSDVATVVESDFVLHCCFEPSKLSSFCCFWQRPLNAWGAITVQSYFLQLKQTAALLFFQWAGLPWRGRCEPALPEHLWLVGQAGNPDAEEERGAGGEVLKVWYQWFDLWLKAAEPVLLQGVIIVACKFRKP